MVGKKEKSIVNHKTGQKKYWVTAGREPTLYPMKQSSALHKS
jgi:hypothetical protein